MKGHTATQEPFTSQCPITFESLKLGHYVLKWLNIPLSTFYIDANLLKLNLRNGALMWYTLFHDAQSLKPENVSLSRYLSRMAGEV